MDKLSTEQRRTNMAAIRSKNTKPEILVRHYLWGKGFRYRINHPRLPGKPDIVLKKYRTCIFVNGCFWHGHNTIPITSNQEKTILQSSSCCKIPKSNTDFWVAKILRNQNRDIKIQHQLATMGWNSITIWECQLSPKQRELTLSSLAFTLNHIYLQKKALYQYQTQETLLPLAAEKEKTSYR